jgi:hypothetical protein
MVRGGEPLSAVGFYDDGGAVGEHFGDALGDLRRVVTHPDDGVAAGRHGVLRHQVERLAPRQLAELRPERDVAAEETLQPGADRSDDRARPHDDPAHDADIAHDPVAGQLVGRGDEVIGNHGNLLETGEGRR